jgi:hypothetical protein
MTDTVQPLEVKKLHHSPRGSRGIWWLASYPKSGSTWARMVLNAAVTGFPPNINAGYQYATADHAKHLLQHTAAIPVSDMTPHDFLCYRLAALRNHLAIFPERDACLKTHNANLSICDVPLIPTWITKGAVYIVRDPRDVVISFAKHLGRDIDNTIELMASEAAAVYETGTCFRHMVSSWSMHVTSWLDEDCPLQVGLIRYEDMHAYPLHAFRKLLDCLGLASVDDDRIAWAVEQCRLDKLRQQEDATGFVEASRKTERFFGEGRRGGWRDVLSPEQVEQIENSHHVVMEQLG